MNEPYCEKEQQLIAALRDGRHEPEILAHAHSCPVCSEVLLVAEFLRQESQLAAHELRARPDAGLIWRKSRALAREEALARATRPIRLVRTCASVVALLAAPWFIFESRRLLSAVPDSWLRPVAAMAHLWPPQALNETALLLGIAGTLISVGLSSWYVLREN